jgi:O-antigen ligase
MVFALAAFSGAALALLKTDWVPKHRLILAACSLLLVANIATVTFGRSGYVVLLAGFGALLLNRLMSFRGGRRRDTVLALLAAGVVVAALAASPTVAQRMTQAVHEMRDYRQAEEVTSMGIRMAFWKNTVTLIQERPLLGYGTGAFAPAYARLVAGKAGVLNSTTGDPHNQFLKSAAENGLGGLGLFLVFLGAAFRQPASQPYRLLGLGALVAWCGTSLFSSHFSTFNEGTLIYLWLGMLLAGDTKHGTA